MVPGNKGGIVMKYALAAPALTVTSMTGAAVPICGTAYAEACGKTCKAGKACDDSCIAREKEYKKRRG